MNSAPGLSTFEGNSDPLKINTGKRYRERIKGNSELEAMAAAMTRVHRASTVTAAQAEESFRYMANGGRPTKTTTTGPR